MKEQDAAYAESLRIDQEKTKKLEVFMQRAYSWAALFRSL